MLQATGAAFQTSAARGATACKSSCPGGEATGECRLNYWFLLLSIRSVLEVEDESHRQVDSPYVLGDGADRDIVDARGSDPRQGVEIDVPRRLQQGRPLLAAIHRYRLAKVGQREIIQQQYVGAGGQRFPALVQVLDLHFDRQPGRSPRHS